MRISPFFMLALTLCMALAACEPASRDNESYAPTSPDVTFQQAPECQLQGGGIDGNGEVTASLRQHRTAIRLEGIFTLCNQTNDGTWFKVYAFVDDGTETGQRILLGSDHDPVVLRRGTDSSGITRTSWQVNIDFVPTSAPLVLPNGFQPRVLVEAQGNGGKIGEVFVYLDESPDPGPRGPRRGE